MQCAYLIKTSPASCIALMFFPKLVQDMAAAGCVVTCVILLSLWPNCVLPQEQEVSSLRPEENPFDVGPINSCQVPQTTFCSMVTYEVPAPIAKLTDFIEMEIRSTVEDPADDQEEVQECMEVYKETLCRKQFPRCSAQDNLVYFEAVENCEERLRNLCPDVASAVIKLEYCSSTQLNLYSGSCRRLSSYNNTLQHCNLLERDILVSDWMYERIRQVDLKLQQEFGLSYLSSQPDCWQKYRNFQCGAVGECVGDRTQLINSREACEAVLNW